VFLSQSLAELRETLRARGGELVVRTGALPDVFERLHRERPFTALYSHEETGNALTYARDKRVAQWCKASGVPWIEIPQTGVIRRLKSRDGWAARWTKRMSAVPVEAPDRVPSVLGFEPGSIPDASALGLSRSTITDAQRGGERSAHATMESFFAGRGHAYATSMSSPVSAW
jgi:deoxyribodipyrimidine photo-lyase